MIYNVITPMNRPENISNMIEMLEPKNVQWHVVTDLLSPYQYNFNRDWIHHHICPNFEEAEFYEKCNNAMNWLLSNMDLQDNQYYCFLNDDDAVEPEYFRKIDDILKNAKENGTIPEILITSMKRGHRTPDEAKGSHRHPPYTLEANIQQVRVGHIGLEQILIRGSLLKEKQYRFPFLDCGDGMFIVRAVRENLEKTIFCPETYAWFNYFEPGRWDK